MSFDGLLPKTLKSNRPMNPEIIQTPIVLSKIRRPEAEGGLIRRERLLAPLREFIRDKGKGLIQLLAPVGYGKTLLCAALCSELSIPTAWLLAEPADSGLRFLEYAVASLNQALSGGAPFFLPDISRLNLSGSQVARYFIEYFERKCEPLVWIIDEIQNFEDEFISDFFQGLLDLLPAKLFLVFVSRINLTLRLSALRTADLLLELRAKELMATRIEVEELFMQADLRLDAREIDRVYQKTEGWFACIKLFILSCKNLTTGKRKKFIKSFKGTQHFIADFLLENFIRNISPNTVRFLVTTSAVSFLKTELCSLLTGWEDCTEPLALLRRSGFLYTVGYGGEKWFRYHHLLRDFLLSKLPAPQRADCLFKAADWFESQGYTMRASNHRNLARTMLASKKPVQPVENGQNSAPFTRREIELLRFTASGLNNREIAQRLYISESTVKWHLNNIFGKIGAKTRTAAVKIARSQHLL